MTDPDHVALSHPEGLGPDLADMLRIIWGWGPPDGTRVSTGGDVDDSWVPVEDLLAMPSSRAGKFLISQAPSRQAARLLISYNGIRTRRTARQRLALAAYLRSGLPRGLVGDRVRVLVPRDAAASATDQVSFPAHLRALMGDPVALLALGVRQLADHHAKPVFHLFTSDGTPEAYAKLGWSDATAPLVLHETAALEEVRKRGLPPGLRGPRLVHAGKWDGHPYLVLEPLPEDVRSLTSWESPRWASRALAGNVWHSVLQTSEWYLRLRQRLDSLGRGSSALAEVAHRAASAVGARTVEWDFGAWHGDWAWWNVAESVGQLHVWDWEHSAPCAPLGFDDLHWDISADLKLRRRPLSDAVQRVASDLAARGVPQAETFLMAYLTEMAVRSCEVSRYASGPPVDLHVGLSGELRRMVAA